MSPKRSCPVCGRPGLPPNCASCPQCDADLTCFQALDSLASPAAVQAAAAPKRRFPWAVAAVLALVALLLVAGLAASMKSRLSELDRQLAELKAAEQRTAAESEQKRIPAIAAVQSTVEQSQLPPDSKIQIDARVRIINEQAAQQAASAHAAGQETKQPAGTAVKPTEERTPALETMQAAAVQLAEPVKQVDASTKLMQEARRQPEQNTDKEELPGSAMSPQGAAQEQVKKKEQDPPASSEQPVSEEDHDKEELADLPETPPVLLKPGFRKHRVRPVSSAAGSEDIAQSPALAAAGNAPPAAQQRGSTFSYVVKDGETAWDIAEQFYGDRKYYPVVIEQNPHIFLGFIRKNSIVRLFADRREAAALYQRKIEQREGLLLWKYEVRPGETWRTIYARFSLPRYSGMIFYGDQDVAPGKTVQIILR